MLNRKLSLIALTVLLSTGAVHAGDTGVGVTIAAQGNGALEQIRGEAARSLPGRIKAQIALPARADRLVDESAAPTQLYVEIEPGQLIKA